MRQRARIEELPVTPELLVGGLFFAALCLFIAAETCADAWKRGEP